MAAYGLYQAWDFSSVRISTLSTSTNPPVQGHWATSYWLLPHTDIRTYYAHTDYWQGPSDRDLENPAQQGHSSKGTFTGLKWHMMGWLTLLRAACKLHNYKCTCGKTMKNGRTVYCHFTKFQCKKSGGIFEKKPTVDWGMLKDLSASCGWATASLTLWFNFLV